MKKRILVVGCFDLYHLGHCDLYEQASKLGTHLTVGVASDNILRAYKKREPIFPAEHRKKIIESNRHVNKVHIYGLKCPDPANVPIEVCIEHNDLAQIELIDKVRPHILAQGQDKTCPLEGVLEKYGIQRVLLERLSEQYISTSGYLKKIGMLYEESIDT